MVNIIVTEPLNLTEEQTERLNGLGKVTSYQEAPSSREDWLDRCKEGNIVLSGKTGLSQKLGDQPGTEGIYDSKPGTLIVHPRVNVAWVDSARLEGKRVGLMYTPGCNRNAVGEWVLGQTINLLRGLNRYNNTRGVLPLEKPQIARGMMGMKAAILGKGNVGTRVAELYGALGMSFFYFQRTEDSSGTSDLSKAVVNAQIIVNCLSARPENENILNANFFRNIMPKGSFFVSTTNPRIYDLDALLSEVESGRLAGAAIDIGDRAPGDVTHPNYTKILDHAAGPRVLATAQIAHWTYDSSKRANDMALENIGDYLSGKPKIERCWTKELPKIPSL